MKRLLLLMAMVVLVPACTHYYVKPGQTSASFDRDKRECQKIAEKEAAKARGFVTSARNACSPKGGKGTDRAQTERFSKLGIDSL